MLIFDKIISYVLNLPVPVLSNWGNILIFLSIFFESTPLFGFLIPGQLIAIIGGILAKMNILDIWVVILIVFLASFLGSLAGYFLGEKYGEAFLFKYGKYFFFKKKTFEKTKRMIQKHVGKSLFIGRFNSFTRAVIPFVAGSMEVNFTKFIFYTILDDIIWAISFVVIGYIFGTGYEIVTRYIGKLSFYLLLMVVLIIFYFKVLKKEKDII